MVVTSTRKGTKITKIEWFYHTLLELFVFENKIKDNNTVISNFLNSPAPQYWSAGAEPGPSNSIPHNSPQSTSEYNGSSLLPESSNMLTVLSFQAPSKKAGKKGSATQKKAGPTRVAKVVRLSLSKSPINWSQLRLTGKRASRRSILGSPIWLYWRPSAMRASTITCRSDGQVARSTLISVPS